MAAVYAPAMPKTPAAAGVQIPAPVDRAFCVPYVGQFVIDQKVFTISSGKFTINDAKGNRLFSVKGKSPLALHTRRVLLDASGKPILTMKKKMMTMHDRWEVYRGEDDSDSNVLFTMAKSSLLQFKSSFDIFLAANNSSTPDFVLRGDLFSFNYVISYRGMPIAEANKKINMGAIFLGKDQYGITVYPGVDHAFIAAIVVIVDQVKQDDEKAQNNNG